MRARRARPRFRLACLAALLAVLLLPASASAHGIVGRADLPIPAWLFAWTATGVMVISFIALWSLWSQPRLQRPPGRVLLQIPRAGRMAVRAASALRCSRSSSTRASRGTELHFEPRPDLRVRDLLGRHPDRERVRRRTSSGPFNPWRALGRLAAGCCTGSATGAGPLLGAYPPWLGRWPAAATLLAFAWLELVYPSKDDPSLLATLMLAYGAVQLARDCGIRCGDVVRAG